MIDRAFIRLDEGLVHYRHRSISSLGRPLFMVHAGPVSSLSLVPFIEALPDTRPIIAPDSLGYGDSAAPKPESPDIHYYADSVIRIMDALGVEKVDYYGSHTGANIGCEVAINHPDRIGGLILEGLGLFDSKTRTDLLENYAPPQAPDHYGAHLHWAWNFLRDQSLHYPYYRRDPEHRLNVPVFPTELLHDFSLDVLKALRTYHKGYNAVFRHDIIARLPLVTTPALVLAHDYDPMSKDVSDIINIMPDGQGSVLSGENELAEKVKSVEAFLNNYAKNT